MSAKIQIPPILPNADSKWLKPEEVRKRLRIGRIAFAELVASGRLRATRVGRSWRIPAEALATL